MGTALDPAWKAAADGRRNRGAVNFDELLDQYFVAFPPGDPVGTTDEIASRKEAFNATFADFEQDEGRVRSQTWSPYIKSGAVLTTKRPTSNLRRALSGDQVRYFAGGEIIEGEANQKLVDLMGRADLEAQRVMDLLRNPMRGNALKRLYDARATALDGLDRITERGGRGEAVDDLRSVVERQVGRKLEMARDYAERAMRLRAAILYELGMASGVVALMLLAGFLLFVFRRQDDLLAGTWFVPTALVLGGLGAVISVLQRITRGQATAGVENGLVAVFLLGMFRPVIGAVMAFALTVLILGGILPIEVPASLAKGAFFLAGISFLAGFSERYAQAMIGAARTGSASMAEGDTSDADASKESADESKDGTKDEKDDTGGDGQNGTGAGSNGTGEKEAVGGKADSKKK